MHSFLCIYTEETVYAIESTEDVVLHKICGKEQVCLFCTNNVCGKERTSSSVSIAGISVDIRPVLQVPSFCKWSWTCVRAHTTSAQST
jgi:hypothetical protein